MVDVRIVEVGPRDGLQNEKSVIPTKNKVSFIQSLQKANLQWIEAVSFVRPDKIPQMSDAIDVMNNFKNQIGLTCLVPNLKGLESALKVGVTEIAVFTATSEEFNKKNINATIDESLERIKAVVAEALKNKIKVRGYISTVFGCPYEGKTEISKLKHVLNELFAMGVYECSLGDTIGVANPTQVESIINELKDDFDLSKIAMHFHDTKGLALANILKSYELGIRTFDSSAGGLGGCPYAKGATGNVATEDVVYMFESMGVKTGVDLDAVVLASEEILKFLKKDSPSKFHQSYFSSKK